MNPSSDAGALSKKESRPGHRQLWRRVLPASWALLSACASQPTQTTVVESRQENVGHQRLRAEADGDGAGAQAYALGENEGYRMPQLHTAPDPVVGEQDPRSTLPPTTICLQVVVDAQGRVERSAPLTDRSQCAAGLLAENAVLLRAAQEAVALWRYSPAAVCHYHAGVRRDDRGDCQGAHRVEPTAVSLLYAFTFEIVGGSHTVRMQGQ